MANQNSAQLRVLRTRMRGEGWTGPKGGKYCTLQKYQSPSYFRPPNKTEMTELRAGSSDVKLKHLSVNNTVQYS